MDVSQLLRKHRKDSGQTQTQLADRTGFSQNQMTRWENGDSITLQQLDVVCKALGLSIQQFFGGEPTADSISAMEFEPLGDAVHAVDGNSEATKLSPPTKTRVLSMLYTLAADLRKQGQPQAKVRAALKRDVGKIIKVAKTVND